MAWPTTRRAGKHRSKTQRELRQDIERLEDELAELEGELDTAGIELSGTRHDLEAARAEIRHLRALAAQPRRQVVVLMTGTQPVRTWPAALGPARDTSSETTQELPIPGRTHGT